MAAARFLAPVALLLGIFVGATIARPSSGVPLSALPSRSPLSPALPSVSPAASPLSDSDLIPGFLPHAPEGSPPPTSPSPLSTIPTYLVFTPPPATSEPSYPPSSAAAQLPSSTSSHSFSSSSASDSVRELMFVDGPEGSPAPTSPSPLSTIPTHFITTPSPASRQEGHLIDSTPTQFITTPSPASSQEVHLIDSMPSAAGQLPSGIRLAAAGCALIGAAAIILF